jgi:hypothetical protein
MKPEVLILAMVGLAVVGGIGFAVIQASKPPPPPPPPPPQQNGGGGIDLGGLLGAGLSLFGL